MTTIHQLHLGHVVLPDSHPRHNEQTSEIYSYVIDHPDRLIVADTGPRTGHRFIDEIYAPKIVSIIDAINAAGQQPSPLGDELAGAVGICRWPPTSGS